MFRFFESISIIDGIPQNLNYHQIRIDHTFKQFYPKMQSHHLDYLISKNVHARFPFVKCKFSYNETAFQFFCLAYKAKCYKKFHLVYNDQINYEYKYIDRSCFDQYLRIIPSDHQILIVKNEMLTDSSLSNLTFYDGYRWLTPATPLLKGTMRASLLADWKIHEESIQLKHLNLFKKFKLINAMNSLDSANEYSMNLII